MPIFLNSQQICYAPIHLRPTFSFLFLYAYNYSLTRLVRDFCEPYRSWKKGSVENVISLIRRCLPKKTNFAIITKEQVKQIENLLNNRPRKCLGYKTPNEIFNEAVALTT